jgi:hypothetical protein
MTTSSHFIVGVQAAPHRLRNGDTSLSAVRRQFIGGVLAPRDRRRQGVSFRGSNSH